jgi:hypothetical protein
MVGRVVAYRILRGSFRTETMMIAGADLRAREGRLRSRFVGNQSDLN